MTEAPFEDKRPAWLPWPDRIQSPPSPRPWRDTAARLGRRVRHPGASLRALFAAAVPLPLRLALLRGSAPTPARNCRLGPSLESALAELETLPPPRRLALIVGAGADGRPAWLPELQADGWHPILADAPERPAPPLSAVPQTAADHRAVALHLTGLARSPQPTGVVVATSPAAWPRALAWAQALRWPAVDAGEGVRPLAPRLARVFPRVAVVMVAYRHPALTLMALASVLRCATWPALEVIVVDNASADGTAEACQEVARRDGRVRVLANSSNLGFPRAVNQGVAASSGELTCILNNDVVVTPGWWEALARELLHDLEVGAVGPSTNAAGNEARVHARYGSLAELYAVAWQHAAAGRRCVDVTQLGFFCVAFRRRLWEDAGGLDEGFGLGYFEDADFCRRVRRRGWRLHCLRHCFVHHEQSAAFATLPAGQVTALYESNRRRYRRTGSHPGRAQG